MPATEASGGSGSVRTGAVAAFGAEIGLALTRRDSLKAILDRCAKAMAQYLNAGLTQF